MLQSNNENHVNSPITDNEHTGKKSNRAFEKSTKTLFTYNYIILCKFFSMHYLVLHSDRNKTTTLISFLQIKSIAEPNILNNDLPKQNTLVIRLNFKPMKGHQCNLRILLAFNGDRITFHHWVCSECDSICYIYWLIFTKTTQVFADVSSD